MKLKSIIGSFLKGALKATPIIGGVAKEIIEQKQEEVEHSASGKNDWARIIGYIIVGLAVIALIFGKLDEDTFKVIVNKVSLFSFFE